MVFQHPSTQKLSGCHVTFELTLGCTQSPEPHFATAFRGTSRRGSSLRSPGRTRPPERTTHGGKQNLERNFSFPVAAGRRWTGSFSQALNTPIQLAAAQGPSQAAPVPLPFPSSA